MSEIEKKAFTFDVSDNGSGELVEPVAPNISEAEPPEPIEGDGTTSPTPIKEKVKLPPIWQVISESSSLDEPKPRIQRRIRSIVEKSGLSEQYNIVFLYDENSPISRFTSNRLYSATSDLPDKGDKKILLILHSNGGGVEPAYLISKCCKKAGDSFVVAVPRIAKSAATLVALGADEIHMGIISELGPIDPQLGGYPALGLSAGVERIVKLCKTHPEVSEMFAKYLASSLNLHNLGYLERISESAVQYAERLLLPKELPSSATEIANKFVYGYKDHGFVIDRDEAAEILGTNIVMFDTPEYALANQLHEYLEQISLYYSFFKSANVRVLGDVERGLYVWKPESQN